MARRLRRSESSPWSWTNKGPHAQHALATATRQHIIETDCAANEHPLRRHRLGSSPRTTSWITPNSTPYFWAILFMAAVRALLVPFRRTSLRIALRVLDPRPRPQHQIINATSGEVLRDFTLDPTRDYQPTGAPKGPTRKKV